MPYLFSYGSNGVEQLAERLKRPVEGYPAYLPGHGRVFRGWSSGWGGGVASIVKDRNRTVYGNVVEVDARDLRTLDRKEGALMNPPKYKRKNYTVLANFGDGFEEVRVIAYVSTSREFNEPTQAYINAVIRNISDFWSEPGGVTLLIK